MTGDQQKINLLWQATLTKAWRWRVFIGSLFSTPASGKETLQDSQAEGWLCAKEVHIFLVEKYLDWNPNHRYAKILMKEGEEEAYRQVTSQFWRENHWTKTQVIDAGFMEPEDKISGSEQHYDFFESLLTGNTQS